MHGQKLLPLIGLLRTPKAVSENPVNPFSSAVVPTAVKEEGLNSRKIMF